MNKKQLDKGKHTAVSLAALNSMRTCLNSKKTVWRAHENQVLTIRNVAMNPSQDIPDTVLTKLLLSRDQCNDLQLLQELCQVIAQAVQQINVVRANHELRLPQLYLVELTDYLLRIDVLIRAAKVAAKRLGVEAVQPKINTEYIERALQKDRLVKQVCQLGAS